MKTPHLLRVAIPVLALGLMAAALSGCAEEGPAAPVGNMASPETAGAPVVLLDRDLSDDIAVDLIRTGPNQNHYLTVQANLRNRTGHDMELQVQSLFYDAKGSILNSSLGNETAWTTLVLTANQTVSYRAQALTTDGDRFTVRVRYLRH